MKFRFSHKILYVFAFVFSFAVTMAGQTTTTNTLPTNDFTDTYYNMLVIFLGLIIIAVIIGFFVFGVNENEGAVDAVEEKVRTKPSMLKVIMQKLTAATPIEKEEDVMLDHNFDGIKELDNKIPPWFSYMFIGTIVFAVIYLLNFHVMGSMKTQHDEYAEEMNIAMIQRIELEKTGKLLDESKLTPLVDKESISNGKMIYDKNCVQCHKADGGGLIGPNLTDQYWIYGGDIKNLYATVKNGTPNGMVSWKTQLNPKQMQEVTSYVLSLQGTNPPNALPPKGELYKAK